MSKFHDLFVKDGRAKVTVAVLVVILVLVSLGIYFSVFINPRTASQSLPPHAKNRVIVRFKESAENNLKKEDVIAGPDVGISSVTALNQKEEVREVKKIVPEVENNRVKGESISSNELDRTYTIEFKNNKDLRQIVEEYAADPNVEYAEPDLEVSTQLTPNDPYYSSSGSWGQSYDDLWGIKKINSNSAWDTTVGSNSIVVAVIDTGIDYNHFDLSDNVWTNADEVPNNGVDDDQNGYIDDYHGYDFYNDDGDPIDDHAHGTHVSGTIAGVGNNGMGVVGVNWQTKIMGVKFLSGGGSGYISDAVSGTYYAVNNGAKVLSNSWGGSGRSTTMQTAIDYAYNNNVTFVAAAGNSNSDAYNYTPAGLNHVMTIAATDYQDNKASFSSYGDVVEFAAPGVDVLSLKATGESCTTVGNYYCRMSGTSMATPHAAGVAVLVLSANPNMTSDQIQTAMQNGADDLGAPGKDIYFGYGRINAANSIVPTVPITHVDGTIIKTSSAPEVYLLEGGQKRHITSPEVFDSWFDWANLIIVSSSEMDSYVTGSDLFFRPGTLIKTSGDPKVYLVDGGNKRHIVSPEIFFGLGYQWANIVSISPSEEDKYNRSDDISSLGSHPNGTLVKAEDAPEVYLLDGGKKRHIPNPEVFFSRYRWGEIVLISASEMSNYAGGDRIGFRPGSLVRAANQPQVYVITGTAKRHISSPSVFSNLGYRWGRIILTTETELNNYTTGENL